MTDAGEPLADSPLAMGPEEFRHAADLAADLAGAHLDGLPHKPVYEPMPAEASRYLLELPIPEGGYEHRTGAGVLRRDT